MLLVAWCVWEVWSKRCIFTLHTRGAIEGGLRLKSVFGLRLCAVCCVLFGATPITPPVVRRAHLPAGCCAPGRCLVPFWVRQTVGTAAGAFGRGRGNQAGATIKAGARRALHQWACSA